MISSALLVLVSVAACAPPVLLHASGAPLVPGIEPIPVEGGWVAFDECAGGIHAIVELDVPKPALGRAVPDPRALRLGVAGREAEAPGSAWLSGPVCFTGPEPEEARVGGPPWSVEEEGPSRRRGRVCVYAVRAQFALARLPGPGEPIALEWNGRTLRFARRAPR